MSEDIFDHLPPWLNLGLGLYLVGIPASGIAGALFLDQGAGVLKETPGMWLAMLWTFGWLITLLIILIALLGILLVAKAINQLLKKGQYITEGSDT